jgi:hypothetical protein
MHTPTILDIAVSLRPDCIKNLEYNFGQEDTNSYSIANKSPFFEDPHYSCPYMIGGDPFTDIHIICN